MSWSEEINEILRKRSIALDQGGQENIKRQHARGLFTIRERINILLDDNSFKEVGPISGGAERESDGSLKRFSPANFILGFGKINDNKEYFNHNIYIHRTLCSFRF